MQTRPHQPRLKSAAQGGHIDTCMHEVTKLMSYKKAKGSMRPRKHEVNTQQIRIQILVVSQPSSDGALSNIGLKEGSKALSAQV